MPRYLFLTLSASWILAVLVPAQAGDHGSNHRAAVLDAVNVEFSRVHPCGVDSGPSGYRIDHFAIGDEWACIAGTAVYHGSAPSFGVKFIALVKWKCGCWQVSSISFDADRVTRQEFVGWRRVPPSILPAWIRWSD